MLFEDSESENIGIECSLLKRGAVSILESFSTELGGHGVDLEIIRASISILESL